MSVMKVNPSYSRFSSKLTSSIYMKCFSQICPTLTSRYLSKLFLVGLQEGDRCTST